MFRRITYRQATAGVGLTIDYRPCPFALVKHMGMVMGASRCRAGSRTDMGDGPRPKKV